MMTTEVIIGLYKEVLNERYLYAKGNDEDYFKKIDRNYLSYSMEEQKIFRKFLIDEMRYDNYGYSWLSIYIIKIAEIREILDEVSEVYMEISDTKNGQWKKDIIYSLLKLRYRNNQIVYSLYYDSLII